MAGWINEWVVTQIDGDRGRERQKGTAYIDVMNVYKEIAVDIDDSGVLV